MFNNRILLKLEQYTLDEKVEELLKNLTKPNYLYALKLLFENSQNEFSPQVLRDTLIVSADPTPFDYYANQSIADSSYIYVHGWRFLNKFVFQKCVEVKSFEIESIILYQNLLKFIEK